MTRISLRDLSKTLLVLIILSFASCARNHSEASSFRIVGLNGEPGQVQTRMPELNARMLESQGRTVPSQEFSQAQQVQQAPQNQQYKASPNADFGSETKSSMQVDQGKPVYNLSKNEAPKNEQPSDSLTSFGAAEDKDAEIQIDLDETNKSEKKSGKKMKLKSGKAMVSKPDEEENLEVKGARKGIFVQTGSFSAEENAKQDFAKVKKYGKGRIDEVEVGDKKVYRVVIGPYPNTTKAKAVVHKIKSAGHDAIVVKNK
jgi:cell division protein FtsN